MNQYQTRHFHDSVAEYVDGVALHSLIGAMSIDLTTTPGPPGDVPRRVVRYFPHPSVEYGALELTGMPLPHAPNLSIFIARRVNDD